jgi:signal recognition particle subunit SRP19
VRQQDKVIIWPIYFDSAKTRADGRRVHKSLAVSLPKVAEIKDAADRLRLECELVPDVAYPKTPWIKTGMLLVKKEEPKENIIRNIAMQLVKIRSSATTTVTRQ